MLEFPKWFYETLPYLSCAKCKSKVKEESITGEGIRKCMSNNEETAFFIEYQCPKCDTATTIELNKMNLEEFTMELLDIFTENIEELDELEDESEDDDLEEWEEEDDEHEAARKTVKKSNSSSSKNVGSKITLKEVETAKDILRESPSHYDFMMNIGLTDELIEQYRKEYDSPEKKKKI